MVLISDLVGLLTINQSFTDHLEGPQNEVDVISFMVFVEVQEEQSGQISQSSCPVGEPIKVQLQNL